MKVVDCLILFLWIIEHRNKKSNRQQVKVTVSLKMLEDKHREAQEIQSKILTTQS